MAISWEGEANWKGPVLGAFVTLIDWKCWGSGINVTGEELEYNH